MRVTIIVPDKRVRVEDVWVKLSDFDWTPFADVHAVQAWLDKDRAEVEFKEVDPDGDGPLPSYKPPNELIDRAAFMVRFAPIMAAYDAADKTPPRTVTEGPAPSALTLPPAVVETMQALADEIAALKAKVSTLDEQNTELLKKLAGAS